SCRPGGVSRTRRPSPAARCRPRTSPLTDRATHGVMVESRKPRRPALLESATGAAAGKSPWFRFRPGTAVAVGVVAAIALLFTLIGVFSGFDKTSGGEVGVVRNGGWFSDNRIRQVIPPGSGLTWIGLFSTVHRYPAQQRFYTITADSQRGDRPGVDVVHTPSGDGVEMGIEATIYFTVNIAPDAIMSFDDKFGTRPFLGADGQLRYAWDGVDGWNGFFDA